MACLRASGAVRAVVLLGAAPLLSVGTPGRPATRVGDRQAGSTGRRLVVRCLNTFLPYPDFRASVQSLDWKRLGKQRVEAYQIFNVILERNGAGWKNSPVVRMWRGYPQALQLYYNECLAEWASQGYKNVLLQPVVVEDAEHVEMPPWLGDEALHATHRSNLLRKLPEHYGQFGWSEPPDMEYLWPVPLPAKEVVAVSEATGEVAAVGKGAARSVIAVQVGVDGSEAGEAAALNGKAVRRRAPRNRNLQEAASPTSMSGSSSTGETKPGGKVTSLIAAINVNLSRKSAAGLLDQRAIGETWQKTKRGHDRRRQAQNMDRAAPSDVDVAMVSDASECAEMSVASTCTEVLQERSQPPGNDNCASSNEEDMLNGAGARAASSEGNDLAETVKQLLGATDAEMEDERVLDVLSKIQNAAHNEDFEAEFQLRNPPNEGDSSRHRGNRSLLGNFRAAHDKR